MTVDGAHQISTWKEAEEHAARTMRTWGFTDSAVTSSGPDGGIDVLSRAAVAQVKFEARQVGRPQLQNLVGACAPLGDRERLFFTGTSYTSAAREYADTMRIGLFVYTLNGHVKPVNQHASRIASRSSAPARPGPSTLPAASFHGATPAKPGRFAPVWFILSAFFAWC